MYVSQTKDRYLTNQKQLWQDFLPAILLGRGERGRLLRGQDSEIGAQESGGNLWSLEECRGCGQSQSSLE